MRLFKYLPLLAVIVLSLTPVLWFLGKGSALINGVDTNFPLDPAIWFERRLYVWDGVANAGRDFSSSTAGLFFHLTQLIPYELGLPLQEVQITSLVFWFSLIVFSAFSLARLILPQRKLIQLLFVVLYSFNIFLFNTWENVKVANLSLVAAIPLALAILLAAWGGRLSKIKVAFYSALVGVVLSGSGINPSYFISFLLLILLFVLGQILAEAKIATIRKILGNATLVLTPIFLVSLFWILPTANFVLSDISPVGSIDKVGFTNWIDSLSENTSILNIMRIQGAWDWYAFDSVTGLPLYIPYSLNYFFRFPFLVFSFLLPGLAILSLVARRRNLGYLYVPFGLMFIVGVFLGVGTHLPTGAIFRWLLIHVPFFSLFRSPWYIFTPLVTLSTAGLVALFFSSLLDGETKIRALRPALLLGVLILIIGNFFYSYPLITGKIFRPARRDGFFITFPKHVFEAQEWLSQNFKGRIIGYPDDEIEQFNWGYRGIESILVLLSDVEVLFSPLNAPDSPVAKIVKEAYQNLKEGELAAAKNLLAKLGTNFIFEKGDQPSLSPPLPQEIKNLPLAEFGPWRFYELAEGAPKIYTPQKFYFGTPYPESAKLLTILRKEEALVNPVDTVVNSIPKIWQQAGFAVLAANSQAEEMKEFVNSPSTLANRLLTRDLSKAVFTFEVKSAGRYRPILERYKLENFGISPRETVAVRLDGQNVDLVLSRFSDSHLYFAPIALSQGKHTVELDIGQSNLVLADPVDNDSRFQKDGEGQYSFETDKERTVLSILNKGKRDISANFNIAQFDPLGSYLVEFKYRQIYGNNALVLVSQRNKQTLIKTQTERLPNYPEWNNFSFYYEPVKTESVMKIGLVSPQTPDPLGTKVLYDELAIFRVFTNDLFFVKESGGDLALANVSFEKVSPVLYKGRVEDAHGPHIIAFLENYSPQWELSVTSHGSVQEIDKKHFSTNFYANAWYIEGAPQDYEFELYYKPQNLFKVGSAFSAGTLGFLFLAYLWERRRKRK